MRRPPPLVSPRWDRHRLLFLSLSLPSGLLRHFLDRRLGRMGIAAVSALQSALSPGRSGTIGRRIPLWLFLCSRRLNPPSAASADTLARDGRPKSSTCTIGCERIGRPHIQSVIRVAAHGRALTEDDGHDRLFGSLCSSVASALSCAVYILYLSCSPYCLCLFCYRRDRDVGGLREVLPAWLAGLLVQVQSLPHPSGAWPFRSSPLVPPLLLP